MKNRVLFLLLIFSPITHISCLYSQIQSEALTRFIQIPDLKHAAISFELKDISAGKIIAAYNSNMSLVPASIAKTVTTATALEVLGGTYTFATPLYYDGSMNDSILTGNLYIEGIGDPTLGSEFIGKDKLAFLKKWLEGIRIKGIKRVDGDIIVLDQLLGYEGISSKWLWEDLGNYYAPGIYGISIFDNSYKVYLKSAASGKAVEILYTEPDMGNLQFRNSLKSGTTSQDRSSISGIPFSDERHLQGSIPPNRTSFPVKGDIPDPGLYLATYFQSYLENNGIQVSGKASTYRLTPVDMQEKHLLATVLSPELSSILRVINVRSNNHYAEYLYKILTVKDRLDISGYWNNKGLDTSALFLYDGSGLSPKNAVSASFLNSLLEYMYKKEGASGAFYRSLPLAGKEGTVVSLLKGSVLEGKARVKSGSMTHVCSYTGYIEHKGKIYVFTLIVNQFQGQRPSLRTAISKLLVSLLQYP